MSEPKFTPGPWEHLASRMGVQFIGKTIPVTVHIAEVLNARTGTKEANANLIAAAPELYAALEFVKAFFTKLEAATDESDPLAELRRRYHAPVHAKIDAALSKARGEK